MSFSFRSLTMLGAMLPAALGTQLTLPSQDPWYSAPNGFEMQKPGTILRAREAPSNITILVNNTAGAYQLLFRSTDARYRASWGVTTVFLPLKANQASRDARALLSNQFAYNTPDADQSPSYGLSTIYGEKYMGNVREGLSRGWAVSVPDFEGPQAAFSAGLQAGHAVLDSVRAILSFDRFEGPDKIRYALWGFSGGAIATTFAAELQASYAPELNFVGTAIGGVPSNATQIVYDITGTDTAAFIPYVLLGLTAQYPEAREYLVSKLHKDGPYNATTFLSALHTTQAEAFPRFAGQDIFNYFTNGDGVLKAREMVRIIGDNWHLGYHGIPQMPVFAYKGINDELTSIGTTDDHVDRMCRVGANVLYQRNTVGVHSDEYVSGGARALKWLSLVLDGKHPEPTLGCKVETVTFSV